MADIRKVIELWGFINAFKQYFGDDIVVILLAALKDLKREFLDDGKISNPEIAEVLGKGLLKWAELQGEPVDD